MINRRVFLALFLLMSLLLTVAPLGTVHAVTDHQVSGTPVRLGTHSVPEASGAVASRAYPGIYWVHSDSEAPADLKLHAIDSFGRTVKTFDVLGAVKVDWEDIAIDENNNLWIGDIGDNNKVRTTYVLYKLPEPNPFGSETTVSVTTTYSFFYPDAQSRDGEGLFVWQGIPYVVRRALFSLDSEVYKVDVKSFQLVAVIEAQTVGRFNVLGGNLLSGADISLDGKRLALVSGLNNRQWVIERDPSSTDVRDFFTSPLTRWQIDFTNSKGEGIAFIPGKYDFIIVGENMGGFWKATQRMYEGIPPLYTVSFEGFDFDQIQEVMVTLNGKAVALLPIANTVGNNDAWTAYSLDVSDETIPDGDNTLTFTQNSGSSKLRNLVVAKSDGTPAYSDSTERSLSQVNPTVTYTFDPRAKPYPLAWEGFDYDEKGEVTITFDGKVLTSLPAMWASANNDVWGNFSLTIWAIGFESNNHTLTLSQNSGSSKVRNVAVKDSSGAMIFSDPTEKGMWLPGNPSVTYTFPGTPPPPPAVTYSLSFEGYDYDDKEEVTITLNGQVVIRLPAAWTSQNNNMWVTFTADVTPYIVSGNNTLTFTQNSGSSKVRNLSITSSDGSLVFSDPTERPMWLPSKPSTTYTFFL